MTDSAHVSTLENVSNVSTWTSTQSFEDLMRDLNETSLHFNQNDFDNFASQYSDENGVLNNASYYNAWYNLTYGRSKRDIIRNANAYIYSGHGFTRFEVKHGVYANIRYRGSFYGQKEKNIVLLVHGWHALHSSDGLFKQLLRFHQKLTPEVGVIYINWENQGARYIGLGNAAEAAIRVNVNALLVDINPAITKLHCIGHSLGAHACAAICRSYRQIHKTNCTRIVGLDPAGPWFQFDSPENGPRDYRLSSSDASYVASLVTNRQMSAIYTPIGHEYLTTNIDGLFSESCGTIGKYVGNVCGIGFNRRKWCEYIDLGTVGNSGIIPHTKDTCSHLMAIVQFMKTLDIENPLAVFKKEDHVPLGLSSFIPSVWTGYTIGKDYTYGTYKLPSTPVWYSYLVDGDSLKYFDIIIVMSKGPIEVNRAKKMFEIQHGDFYETLLLSFNTYDRRIDYYMRVSGQFYLMRVRKPKSHIGDEMVPMTAFAEMVYRCDRFTNMFFTHHCVATNEHKIVPVYRKQMSLSSKVVSVPPMSGCLDFENELSDIIPMKIPGISVFEGELIKIKLNVTHNDELLKVILNRKIVSIKHSTNYTLFTLWDSCRPTYCADVEVKRLENIVEIKFNDIGYFDLYFVFQYHRDTLPIRVIHRPVMKTNNRYTKPVVHTTPFAVSYRIWPNTPSMSITSTSTTTPTSTELTTKRTSTKPTSNPTSTISPNSTETTQITIEDTKTTTIQTHNELASVAKHVGSSVNNGGLSGGLVGGIMLIVVIVVGGIIFVVVKRRPTIVVIPGEANELMSSCA